MPRQTLAERFAPRLTHLREVKRKIRQGEPVKIGVFCSGNSDRSPLAQQVLQEEFRKAGLPHVAVFSFGMSAPSEKEGKPASERTTAHAIEMGYPGIKAHVRRGPSDPSVLRDLKEADLVLAISPAHADYLAEYSADLQPESVGQRVLQGTLRTTWTLRGFAEKKEWQRPFQGTKVLPMRGSPFRRSLAMRDPYFYPKTPEGERQFRDALKEVQRVARLAVKRLTSK